MGISLERWVYYLVIAITIFIILFGTTYLPMNDLPQHAGQVVALDDILKGKSLWGELVEFNIFTPYLIGYAIWLILYQFFDILVASRLVIACTFLFYVFSFHKIREHYNAEKIVDWVVIPSFFGFAYYYGFVTFLIGIPVGIIFFIVIRNWFENNNASSLILSLSLGVLLFFSHILSFLFFVLLAFCSLIVKHKLDFYKYLTPFVFFGFFLIFYLSKGDTLGDQYSYGDNEWIGFYPKLLELFVNTWILQSYVYYIYILGSISLLLVPFVSGYKLSKKIDKYVPILVFLICWFSLPLVYDNIYYIYNRYTLLFFGFYYLIFEKSNQSFSRIPFYLFLYLIVIVLLLKVWFNILNFNKESEEFNSFIRELPYGKKAVGLVFSKNPILTESLHSFVHFPVWYQAQQHGWVDYNFAWASPQLIRFKKDKTPEMVPRSEWSVSSFLHLQNCDYYDLVIVKIHSSEYLKQFMKMGNCAGKYKPLLEYNHWIAYEKIVNP